jgi:hypothetical protein
MTNAVALAQGASNNVTFRNKIINGGMVIDQRNAGASITASSTITYSVDRWGTYSNPSSKFTAQQNAGSVTPPAGYTNYLGCTSSSAYSPTGTDIFMVYQAIEGYNIADLGWGTANAKTITISFWVRSSLTGSFGAVVSGGTWSYPILYTISAANTWEQKTITIAGATTGTWGSTNGNGILLKFSLGAGSTFNGTSGTIYNTNEIYGVTGQTQVVGTNGATWYITGVQLEAGTTASPFEYRQYTTEFTLCQRYYYKISVQGGASSTPFALCYTRSSSGVRPFVTFPTPMRVRPTSVETSGTASDYTVYYAGDASATCTSVPDFDVSSNLTAILGANVSGTPFPSGGITYLRSNSTSAYLGFSAEL